MPNDSNLDPEPVPFLRQDAVESARGDLAAAPRGFFQSPDSLEEYLYRRKDRSTLRLRWGYTLTGFAKAYGRFKSRRGDQAAQAQAIVEFQTPPDKLERPLQFEKGSTFSNCMGRFSEALRFRQPESLVLCAIAVEPPQENRSKPFSFLQIIITTRRALYDVPRQSIAFVLEQEWDLEHTKFLSFVRLGLGPEIRNTFVVPPSYGLLKGDLDPTQPNDGQISLRWHHKAPKYKGDFDVFIWQPHQEEPVPEFAHIFFPMASPKDFSFAMKCMATQPSRMIIMFRSSEELQSFSSIRRSKLLYRNPIPSSNAWSVTAEQLLAILGVYHVMIKDLTTFTRSTRKEIQAMKIIVRCDPTPSKVRYLIHLNDCRLSAQDGITHSQEILQRLGKIIQFFAIAQPLWDAGISWNERLASMEADLHYLYDELTSAGKGIEELQSMLREHLSLTQNNRTFILTVLAALYLPVSFATSLLGMNLQNTTPDDFSKFSDFTNATLLHLPADVRNSTSILLATVSSSSGYLWEIKYFGIIAGPLLLTVPLSVIAGGIFRWAFQSAAVYVTYWRIFTILFASWGLFGLYWVLPFYSLNLEYDEFCSGGNICYPGGYVAYIVISVLLLGPFTLWKIWRAFQEKREQRTWLLFGALVAVCISLDNTVAPNWLLPDPIMALPWLYLIYRWASPYVMGWRKRRRSKKDSIASEVRDPALQPVNPD